MSDPIPVPPSDEGNSLPSRHRPTLGSLSQDTTELDLWAFDDDLETSESEAPSAPRGVAAAIPSPREQRPQKKREPSNEAAPAIETTESIKINVSGGRHHLESPTRLPVAASEGEFDDLESWEDPPKGDIIEDLPDEAVPVSLKQEPAAKKPPEPEPKVAAPTVSAPQLRAEEDEFSPKRRTDLAPASLRRHLGLSVVERAGLVVLMALLLGVGIFAYLYSINRLPEESTSLSSKEFPVKGSYITVESASSYWREPITEGPNADTIRRETQLLPVLVLKISEGQGAVRILFRDGEGNPIGDALTRPIRGEAIIDIPATAGFNDIGMYAAYRMETSKPWSIEIFEGATELASGDEIKMLFEMKVSADRR